ncbi:TFIIH/NER complex subunit [Malassezia cuniculi]|uniref:RNA polymerase II transcription factor B subunit 3 n=1 Tax=Malassezia cuniculi TaxID=948313 RepID=A0AAF0F1N5_9BASI|nr:TFIIH/NER complex subunit [Malassezia cuniculi]
MATVKPRVPTAGGRQALGQAQIIDKSGRITEYSSESDKCPQCKTDRYLSPRLRLLVSPCYHKMCESCIDRLFSLGPAACPECGTIVRKQQFSAQMFQDLRVEEEVNVRRRVGKLLNRRPDEFPSLRAYNDYLEEFEEITFNLVNKIDVERTQSRLAQYEALNRSLIAAQQHQREQESEAQLLQDQAARRERQLRAKRIQEEQEREREFAEQDEKIVVAELAKGRSVEEVFAERQKRVEERAKEAQRREAAERRRQQAEEQRRLAIEKVEAAARPSVAEAALQAGNVAARDFSGPLATVDDGSSLADVRAAPASIGGLGSSSDEGYVDPWLKAELVVSSWRL